MHMDVRVPRAQDARERPWAHRLDLSFRLAFRAKNGAPRRTPWVVSPVSDRQEKSALRRLVLSRFVFAFFESLSPRLGDGERAEITAFGVLTSPERQVPSASPGQPFS